jgi:hypothetical protein
LTGVGAGAPHVSGTRRSREAIATLINCCCGVGVTEVQTTESHRRVMKTALILVLRVTWKLALAVVDRRDEFAADLLELAITAVVYCTSLDGCSSCCEASAFGRPSDVKTAENVCFLLTCWFVPVRFTGISISTKNKPSFRER